MKSGDKVYYQYESKTLKCTVLSNIEIQRLKEGNYSATINIEPDNIEELINGLDDEDCVEKRLEFYEIPINKVYDEPFFCQ